MNILQLNTYFQQISKLYENNQITNSNNFTINGENMIEQFKIFLDEFKDIITSNQPTIEMYENRINQLLKNAKNKSDTYKARLKLLQELIKKN